MLPIHRVYLNFCNPVRVYHQVVNRVQDTKKFDFDSLTVMEFRGQSGELENYENGCLFILTNTHDGDSGHGSVTLDIFTEKKFKTMTIRGNLVLNKNLLSVAERVEEEPFDRLMTIACDPPKLSISFITMSKLHDKDKFLDKKERHGRKDEERKKAIKTKREKKEDDEGMWSKICLFIYISLNMAVILFVLQAAPEKKSVEHTKSDTTTMNPM